MLRSLVILQGYDPSGPTLRTFYLTNGTPFITGSGETPASQSFDPVLAQPFDLRRRMQSIGGGLSMPTVGEIRIQNHDGAYDAWADYAFDGRAITVRTGPAEGAYPSAYPVTFTGTMDRVDVLGDEIVIRVRDVLAELNTPLQDAIYAGDNVPPDGLEGGDDLAGRRKPLVFGKVKGITPVLVNEAKLIYQVSDTAISTVDAVYDNGVALGIAFKFSIVHSTGAHVAVTYGGSQYVAVGASGRITTSPTGATWTTQTSSGGGSSTRNAVTYGNGLYVVAGDGPYLETSPDGVTWTVRTSGFTAAIYGAAYGGGVYVITGGGAELASSSDGTTWTARTSGFSGGSTINAVAWSDDIALFCAVGSGGQVTTSPDGTTWTARTSATTNLLRAVHWADDQFVAVGASGTIQTSPDGIAWTLRDSGTVEDLYSVSYAEGQWMAGSAFVASPRVSEDGVVWTSRGPLINAYGIASDGLRFVVAGNSFIHATDLPTTYASLADLEDDSLEPGAGGYKYIAHADGSYIRLGSAPFGEVTADVSHGANDAARTAGQLFVDVLEHRGYTTGDWSASDITALDTADNAVCGIFVDNDETALTVLDALARTVGAWWGVDASGVIRIAQLTAPSGSSTFDITANDMRGRLVRVAADDPFVGLPNTKTTLRWARSSTPLLDGTATDTDATVLTTHLLARETIEDTYYTTLADAEAEAARRQTLRGTKRSAYRVTVSLEDYADIELGQVGTLTHPRFGLSGGVLVRVIAVEPNARDRSVTLTLWR